MRVRIRRIVIANFTMSKLPEVRGRTVPRPGRAVNRDVAVALAVVDDDELLRRRGSREHMLMWRLRMRIDQSYGFGGS